MHRLRLSTLFLSVEGEKEGFDEWYNNVLIA